MHRRRGDRWGVTHFGSGSGGRFFVRIVILPTHDVAVVIASNSGDAGPATRQLWPEMVR
ncbi:MAG: hypothetical protein H0U85_05065 [Gemmatimonadales bacterium]|nr:hypothetical protein [Gemmatimonadales bacterium]